jgi:hypothetical protein
MRLEIKTKILMEGTRHANKISKLKIRDGENKIKVIIIIYL